MFGSKLTQAERIAAQRWTDTFRDRKLTRLCEARAASSVRLAVGRTLYTFRDGSEIELNINGFFYTL